MCLYPREMKNKRYEPTKKNGGIVPKCPDNRLKTVPVPCGNCMECRKKKKNEWQVRLLEEIKENKNGKFVTLTFSNQQLKKHEELVPKGIKGYARENAAVSIAMRRFLERWRKSEGKSVKHCFITELGHNGTERIHLHGFLWTDKTNDFIARKWRNGRISIGDQKYYVNIITKGKQEHVIVKEGSGTESYVNDESVRYITKYVNKIDKDHMYYKSKMYVSNGIGKAFINGSLAKYNKYKGKRTWEKYTQRDGSQLGLPKYYREKLYTEEQREQLWLNKIDDKIKWVDGIKVDISDHLEVYYTLRNAARHKNHRLGYGSNYKDTVREYLENQRRNQLAWCRANGKHPRKRQDPQEELKQEKENKGLLQMVENPKKVLWDIMGTIDRDIEPPKNKRAPRMLPHQVWERKKDRYKITDKRKWNEIINEKLEI